MAPRKLAGGTSSQKRNIKHSNQDSKGDGLSLDGDAVERDDHRMVTVPFQASADHINTSNPLDTSKPYCIDAAGYQNDPVEKEWTIFLNPTPDNRHVVVLRYPHRSSGDPYLARKGQQPLEIRIKPRSGLVEVDVPLHVHQKTYDKQRGMMYGEAIRKNELLQAGGSFGVRGGLGNANTAFKRPEGSRAAMNGVKPSAEDVPTSMDEPSEKGHIMSKITMAGVITPWEETDPVYFLATFKEGLNESNGKPENCVYLTKVDAIVELNPILDHVDALRDNERATSARAARGTGERLEEGEARAINMTIKAIDEEGEEMETLGERSEVVRAMNAMRDEPWQRLEYHDSETLEAWDQYDSALSQRHPEGAPRLVSSMSNEQWIDAISAPREDPTRPTTRTMAFPKNTRSAKRENPSRQGPDTKDCRNQSKAPLQGDDSAPEATKTPGHESNGSEDP